ncbi:hypothetical protein M434DRAFT_38162 [Hypoxylon sp. CO27-5]|nr:hypothetical protein M434DRAFT_38162 [Hypoxylon sp. CO27-5]
MSTCSWDDTPSSRTSSIAYKPATPAQVGRHSGSYFDAAGPWTPHLGHSYLGLKGGRSAHDQEHAFTLGSSNLTENPLGSSKLDRQFRQNFYEGLFGQSKRDITSSTTGLYAFPVPENVDPNSIPVHSPSANPLKIAKSIPTASCTPSVSSVSQISSEAKQRELARDIFEQHGIRRPPGWFSDDEDLSLLGDRTAGHRRFCRICHVCLSRNWSQTHCLSCKHRLCAKCVCEVPKSTEEAHSSFLHDSSDAVRLDETRFFQPGVSTPRPRQVAQKLSESSTTIVGSRPARYATHGHHQENNDASLQTKKRGDDKSTRPPSAAATGPLSGRPVTLQEKPTRLLKQNSFIIADREARDASIESPIVEHSAFSQSRDHICSQRHTDDSDHGVSSTKVECDDPICRATHDGHHPYRHSITCALHRNEEAEKCKGLHREFLSSENASVTHLPNPLSNKDGSRSLGYTTHQHCATVLYHHHDIKHPCGEASYGFHEPYTNHNGKFIGEARISTPLTTPRSKSRVESSETYTVAGQSQGFKSFETKHVAHSSPRHEHSHETISNSAMNVCKAGNRNPSPATITEAGDHIQIKSLIPKGRVLSPPPWLKRPSKEAGDARSRLRHVINKSHGYAQESRTTSLKEKARYPRTPVYTSEFVRGSFSMPINSCQDLMRTSAPSPLTASHITQHQRPEPWLDHSSEHIHSRTSHKSSIHAIGTPSTSHREYSPTVDQKASSHHGRRSSHLQVENANFSRSAYLSPSSARSLTHSRPTVEGFDHVPSSAIRENASSSIGRISHSPLQPRRILINIDESTTSESHTSMIAPELEIHRPTPIVPPNHDCSWKDRYMALAAEIRLLKAELSTRASLAIRDVDYTGEGGEGAVNDDDDLGIEGVTIIMHLRGRDDLVINTDLTRDPDQD